MAVTVTPPQPANEMSTIDVMPEWQQVLFHSLYLTGHERFSAKSRLRIYLLRSFSFFLFFYNFLNFYSSSQYILQFFDITNKYNTQYSIQTNKYINYFHTKSKIIFNILYITIIYIIVYISEVTTLEYTFKILFLSMINIISE